MSTNRNILARLVSSAVSIGGAIVLASSIYQLGFNPPNLRYWLLLTIALVVSWPKLKLPVKAAEPLFFLSLLIYGPPAAIFLSVIATVIASRLLLTNNKLLWSARVGQSALSASVAGMVYVQLPLLLGKESSLILNSSVSLINVLAWMAWVRFLFHSDWAAVAQTIRGGKIKEKFTEGTWLNSFVAYFGAAFTAGIVLLITREERPQITLLSLLVLTIFYFAYRHFKDKYIEKYLSIHHNAEELSELHLRTIEALSTAIEAKDQQSHLQAQRIQVYTEGVGKALGLSEPELIALRAASLLRDIGKLAVPDYILHKSEKLTDAELEKMKMHPVIGASILERVKFPYPLVPAIKHHHEHWDGTGYPDQLRGEEIPLTARILAVVDDFDTACGGTPTPATRESAINLLIRESGRKYDPEIVQTFLNHFPALQAEIAQFTSLQNIEQADLALAPTSEVLSQGVYLDVIRRARQEGSELLDLAQALSSTLNLEEAVSIIISRLSRLTTFDTYAIYVCEEITNTAYVAGAIGNYADELRAHQVLMGYGAIGQALATGERVYEASATLELAEFAPKIQQTFKSMTIIPLGKADRIIGALVFLSKLSSGYSVENQRVVDMVVPLAADALYNALAYRRTETSAITDVLTGLPNSRMLQIAFSEESNRAERYGTKLAMLMIDLDGFKQVNDTFGHLSGDQILREVAHCLKQELRASDKLIRYAGDEFIALLPHADERSINDLIIRIQTYLESRCHLINGIEVRLGASIGYAIFGRDGRSLNELMRVADEGMYRNKAIRKKQIKPRRPLSASSASGNEATSIIFSEAVAS